MEKKKEYLAKYWLKYYLTFNEDGEVTLQTSYKNKKFPDVKYEVSLFNDNELSVLLPIRAANRLLKKYPDILTEYSDSDEGKQLIFEEKNLETIAKDIKLIDKNFPSDFELIKRFINHHIKKIEQKKARKKKKKVS